MILLTDAELDALEADQRRGKSRPDRRRRQVIRLVERLRMVDAMLQKFCEALKIAEAMPGSPEQHYGVICDEIEEFSTRVDWYRKETKQ